MSRQRTATERAAATRYEARRRRLIKCGQWQPFADAEPVRKHLRSVNAAGMPYEAIGERLGLASSLRYVLWGHGEHGPGQQVRRETAELILSYWPSLDDFPDAARIDATGTRRRVQALAVCGWPRRAMAQKIGVREDYFRKAVSQNRVTARLARGVRAVYDAWWDQDPLDHGVPSGPVLSVRAESARLGFHPALAWDDDTIDDPQALPQTDADAPVVTEGGSLAVRWLMGESVILGRDDRREVIRHLFEWTNDTPEEIAARLDMAPKAAERQWERIKKQARADGRRVWRRVYVPRERTLEKREMGEAA